MFIRAEGVTLASLLPDTRQYGKKAGTANSHLSGCFAVGVFLISFLTPMRQRSGVQKI